MHNRRAAHLNSSWLTSPSGRMMLHLTHFNAYFAFPFIARSLISTTCWRKDSRLLSFLEPSLEPSDSLDNERSWRKFSRLSSLMLSVDLNPSFSCLSSSCSSSLSISFLFLFSLCQLQIERKNKTKRMNMNPNHTGCEQLRDENKYTMQKTQTKTKK